MTNAEYDEANTTERLNPSDYLADRSDAVIYACHLATYDFALGHVTDRDVLDFGCGLGYGTHRIAAATRSIVGVDVSADAIAEARRRYEAPNLSFRDVAPAEAAPLPFGDDEFDVVLSFQVFEHLPVPDAYLAEVARVLRPDGLFICVTPEHSPRLFAHQRPWNPFHLREYSQDEMQEILGRHFDSVEVAGMTARSDMLEVEMRRVRKLRLSTYPLTFPGVPEKVRVSGLHALKRLRARRAPAERPQRSLSEWGFGPDDVEVFSQSRPSLNVVCLARRPS